MTVIMPVFNAARYVATSLKSVLGQSFSDFEIIVVDDGSTDESADIVAKAASADPRIILTRQVNSGVSSARNNALMSARGKYLTLIDSDDLWHQHKLKCQLAVISGREDLFVLTGVRRFRIANGDIIWGYESLPPPLREERFSIETLMCLADTQMQMINTALMPAKLVSMIGGWREGQWTAEDWDFWLRSARTANFSYIAEPLYFYRKHPSSSTRSHHLLDVLEQHEAILRRHAVACDNPKRVLSAALLKRRLDTIGSLLHDRHVVDARRVLRMALTDPRAWPNISLWRRAMEVTRLSLLGSAI